MLQVLGESKRSQGRSALYADACQQIADAIRVRCNQLSVLCGRLATTGLGVTSEHATCFAALSAYTWLHGRLAGLEWECFAANSQAGFETDYVKHHQEVHAEVLHALSRCLPRPPSTAPLTPHCGSLSPSCTGFAHSVGHWLCHPPTMCRCLHQWCQERLTLWNAWSQTEGDDLGISVCLWDCGGTGERDTGVDRQLAESRVGRSITGCVHDSLMSELQDLARLIQYHCTQHVESNQGQQSHTRDVLLVPMDWDSSSMRYVLKEFPSIKQCELRYRTS